MLLIVLLHCNYFALGGQNTFDIHSIEGFTRVFLEQLTIVGVDVFVLISGWFGICAKLKGAISLLFQVVFFSVVITLLCKLTGIQCSIKDVVKSFYFGCSYWFVPAYLALYALTPILNSFIEHAPRNQFRNVLICFFVFEIFCGWIIDVLGLKQGYHVFSFMGLYLLARYVRLYPSAIFTHKWYVDLSMYFALSLIPAVLELFVPEGSVISKIHLAYHSPFVIGASLFLLLAFSKWHIHSNFVNWFASSAFAVYLMHQHPSIQPLFITYFSNMYDGMAGYEYVFACIIIAAFLFVVSIMIDNVRKYVWKLITDIKHQHNCFGVRRKI